MASDNDWIGRIFSRIRPGTSYRAFPWRSWEKICLILESIKGSGIRIRRTESGQGWALEVDKDELFPRGVGGAPAVVKSYAGGVYTVDIYANGLTSSPTEENVQMVLPEVAQLSALPYGTVVLAHLVSAPLVPMDEDYEETT